MGDKSDIEWTDATWSPVTGCTKKSAGCKNCWAEHEVETRWSKNPKSVWFGRAFTDVQCHADKLDQPLHWKKPRRIFVCPRADLFHEDVPEQFILSVFVSMALAAARRHTFQILTKRAARMLDLMTRWKAAGLVLRGGTGMTLRNVWLGVSVEDQASADERIPLLLRTPASVRWVSAEPLIGRVDLCETFGMWWNQTMQCFEADGKQFNRGLGSGGIDWLVAGGESGPNARPSHPDWFRSLRDQCAGAGVPFFHKQNGEWVECETEVLSEPPGKVVYPLDDSIELSPNRGYTVIEAHGTEFVKVGKKRAGRLLDGREHSEFPL